MGALLGAGALCVYTGAGLGPDRPGGIGGVTEGCGTRYHAPPCSSAHLRVGGRGHGARGGAGVPELALGEGGLWGGVLGAPLVDR